MTKSLSVLDTTISTPDALVISTVPSDFAVALKSPITAVLNDVTKSAMLFAVQN